MSRVGGVRMLWPWGAPWPTPPSCLPAPCPPSLQVSRLKASRDKLLEQVDKQWEEMDRLAAENKAASDELDAVRCASAGWEAQAQEGLAQAERLKEMLEEAARWSSEQAQGAARGYVAAVNGTTPCELDV